ncbi:uncharacterized protein CDAR_266781 [Caerostris darwini]|uniref:Integrase zinc-binding domain-containing protein n=1 Tax=Caerostris darwini TaxID=1538125 RepID=A0AAV4QI14_9ARAC|nr:uncharacterized protein CDAR_266781 [Caerostris darwini]
MEKHEKNLRGFLMFEDEEGILRLNSRLINEEESKDFISPIILPSKHLAVRRFIAQEHLVSKHAGTLTLLTILRERFWIVKGKTTARNVIKEYLTCKRQKVKHLEVPFLPLPKDRTEVTAVFQVSGVDLAGPVLTKSKRKVWIVLFTCAVLRAVHLELIPSLGTNDFIQAMRRFIARRGRISVMYSDNGAGNRRKLAPVIKTIILGGRRGIALEAHRDFAEFSKENALNCFLCSIKKKESTLKSLLSMSCRLHFGIFFCKNFVTFYPNSAEYFKHCVAYVDAEYMTIQKKVFLHYTYVKSVRVKRCLV